MSERINLDGEDLEYALDTVILSDAPADDITTRLQKEVETLKKQLTALQESLEHETERANKLMWKRNGTP